MACCVAGDVATDGVAVARLAMGVELTALVARGNVHARQVGPSLNLVVEGCLDKVDGLECAVWDDTGVVTRLDTPRDLLRLRVADRGAGSGRGKDAAGAVC